jgi:pimeloyl-ACP methyl ester carboxylesterase
MSSTSLSCPGTLHRYTKRLSAFEHSSSDPSTVPNNIILWIGGLGDGLLTVSYPRKLAAKLPPSWSIAEVLLASSYNGFGTSSLARDAKEIGQCVAYFRNLRGDGDGKIVLMGHSTGSQDCMEYVVGKGHEGRPKVDGIVLQGSVSDREALVDTMPKEKYESIVKVAKEYIKDGRGEDVVPASAGGNLYGRVALTAYRLDSFLSPDGPGVGDDDYFSSDLPDERLRETFGAIGKDTPLLILFSGDDESVPKHVDKQALVEKWAKIVKENGGNVDEEHGGIVPMAHHNYENDTDDVVDDLCRRVCGFVNKVEKGAFTNTTSSHL